ncbi:MAG TPA: UDP-N-acetylmuramoyl-tripeptide--D-alanyl-D-alanine ligase [Flavobacteriales bacterium]|nr:UDP-N-acetylmuramoyl-tripeptide--D-alanyl-D-alanine ligase [Flavobacteriales bacterium]
MITIEQLHEKFKRCNGACTDTRAISSDSMFFALKGPNFNANVFASAALEAGARFAVVDDPTVALDDRFLLVENVLAALQDVARFHRRRCNIPVLGITGSNGKTTTKELINAVLAARYRTLATIGNLNNHIGVPLTLLRLTDEDEMAIIEMGANKPGDIAELAHIAEPTHGLITNIGRAHLQGFGGPEGVLRTKTELFAFVKAHHGKLFVNADDAVLMEKANGIGRVSYGTDAMADIRGAVTSTDAFLGLTFVGSDGRTRTVRTKLVGDYNFPNAMAAIACGREFGVDDDLIVEALEAYEPGNNRSQFKDTGRNQLILDAYNANPSSMAAAIRNFSSMSSDREKLLILGDMLELGASANAEHRAIAQLVDELELDTIFVGPLFRHALGSHPSSSFEDASTLLTALTNSPVTGKLILLKGSRGTKLETVVPVL